MTTLHILNKSPQHPFPASQCVLFYSPQDSILLIEDAVYYTLTGVFQSFLNSPELIKHKLKPVVYALREDIEARGIIKLADSDVQIVSYTDFVELTANHDKSSSWY